MTALIEALPDIITQIVTAIPQIIDALITAILGSIPQIIEAGIDLLVALIQALPQIITTIVQAIPEIIAAIVNAFAGNIDKIIMAGVELFVALIENLPTIIVEIVKAVPQIIEGIVSAFGSLMYKIVEVGGNIVKGLWEGIKGLAGWIWDKVSGWASDLWSGIKSFFGISSPSKEMAWIGEMLVEGLAGAIERSGGDAVRASEGLAEDINNVMGQLGKDMSVALPTDFQVQAETAVSGALRGVAPIGSFPQITIEQMFVRSEDDIRKVSQELYNLIEAGSRAQGRFSPA